MLTKEESDKRRLEYLRKQAESHPDCSTCRERLKTGNFTGPAHKASDFCRSGKRDYCSCDTCY